MEKDKLLQKRDDIKQMAERLGLKFVVLFGSEATGKTHQKSDVDIAVLPNNDMSNSISDTSAVWSEFVDMLNRDDVEVVDVRNVSPTLNYDIAREGIVLYSESEEFYYDWKLRVIREWMDTKWLRDLQFSALKKYAEKYE